MPRPRKPHLHKQFTRHGATVWYVRIGKGPRTRILGAYGSAEFNEAYDAAIAGKPKPVAGRAASGSLRWLVKRYMESASWGKLSAATRKQRGNIFVAVLAKAGDEPFSKVTRKHIIDGRERRKATPNQARHFVVTMRGLFLWAIEQGHCTMDPTEGVKSPRPKTDGHHTWTPAECDRFEAKYPVGTHERLAYDVLLYTGLRRGDAAKLGRQHVRNGVITIRTEKTGEMVTVPVLPPLARSIEATPTGEMTFIISAYNGKAFTKESFGNWFRGVCDEAGVQGSAHGLRKAGATRAAENGATESELEAIFGWRGGKMAALYTRQANRTKLSTQAASKLLGEQEPNVYSLTPSKSEGQKENPEDKTTT
jgi:integrase